MAKKAAATGGARHTGPSFDPIKTHSWIYLPALIGLAVLYLIGGAFSSKTVALFGNQFNMIWFLGVLHFATGVRIVSREKIGGVLILGIPTIEITGTLVIVPAGLFKLATYPLAPIEIRVPRDPSKVWRGGKDEDWPEGFEEPLRVPFDGREHKDIQMFKKLDGTELDIKRLIDPNDPLLMRGTQEVSFYVRLVIKSRTGLNEWGFFDFYVRIGSYAKARQQVKEIGTAKIFEDFTKVSMAEALKILEPYNEQFEQHLRDLVRPWGVEIPTAKVMLQFTQSLNESILEIPKAKAKARATVLTAEGAKAATILAAEADKRRIVLELQGKGEGQRKQMDKIGVTDAKIVIAAEVADSMAKSPNEKILLLGADGLVGAVSTIANRLGK